MHPDNDDNMMSNMVFPKLAEFLGSSITASTVCLSFQRD